MKTAKIFNFVLGLLSIGLIYMVVLVPTITRDGAIGAGLCGFLGFLYSFYNLSIELKE